MQSFLALDFFKYRAKEKSNIYFLRDFQIMVKNDQQWKTLWIIVNMTMFRKEKISPI